MKRQHRVIVRGWAHGHPALHLPQAFTATERTMRIGHAECIVGHFTDAPRKRLDILVAHAPTRNARSAEGDDLRTLIEVSEVTSGDGTVRPRIVLRAMWPMDIHFLVMQHSIPEVVLYTELSPSGGGRIVEVRNAQDFEGKWDTLWSLRMPTLRTEVTPDGLERIVGYHATRWFPFLPWGTVQAVQLECVATWRARLAASEPLTLVECNRTASNALYAAARAEGYTRLTAREKSRIGAEPDSGTWHRTADVAARRLARRGVTGCGEATIVASWGPETGHPDWVPEEA